MSDITASPDNLPEANLGRLLSKPFDVRRTRRSIFSAFLEARGQRGGKTQIIIDGDDRKFTYDEITRAAFGLGSALRSGTKRGENVGVLLPTGAGAAIAFFAVSAYGRVPAMLNFTSGPRALKAACTMSRINTIVTAHKFVDLGGYEALIKDLEGHARIVYLEDVRENLSLGDKIAGGLGPFIPWAFMAKPHPDTPSVILFTSGTEGDPKGVVLSHANVVSNIEQVRDHIELFENDAVFNPLPMFHCFGLTLGTLMPLLIGVTAVFHPTPLQAKEIAKRVRKTQATLLLATDTFMSQYARAGAQGDLNSLRIAVLGAERVKDETRQLVRKKFNIELLEGYGATEAAPVAAANKIGGNKPGTVGKLMAGMECKLEDVPGIEEGGRLYISGPNIMLGYLKTTNPGVIEAPDGGWHDTGDIVTIDDEGYITIRGRLKRFAKVAGEMVSLAVVENCATSLWEENRHAAVAIPDKRKGEQIVLISDCKDANRADMVAFAKNHGVPELAVPRRVLHTDEIPILGTGKINYGEVAQLVHGLLDEKPAEASPKKVEPAPEAAPETAPETKAEPEAPNVTAEEPSVTAAATEPGQGPSAEDATPAPTEELAAEVKPEVVAGGNSVDAASDAASGATSGASGDNEARKDNPEVGAPEKPKAPDAPSA